jgi:hypothetical protein
MHCGRTRIALVERVQALQACVVVTNQAVHLQHTHISSRKQTQSSLDALGVV